MSYTAHFWRHCTWEQHYAQGLFSTRFTAFKCFHLSKVSTLLSMDGIVWFQYFTAFEFLSFHWKDIMDEQGGHGWTLCGQVLHYSWFFSSKQKLKKRYNILDFNSFYSPQLLLLAPRILLLLSLFQQSQTIVTEITSCHILYWPHTVQVAFLLHCSWTRPKLPLNLNWAWVIRSTLLYSRFLRVFGYGPENQMDMNLDFHCLWASFIDR